MQDEKFLLLTLLKFYALYISLDSLRCFTLSLIITMKIQRYFFKVRVMLKRNSEILLNMNEMSQGGDFLLNDY